MEVIAFKEGKRVVCRSPARKVKTKDRRRKDEFALRPVGEIYCLGEEWNFDNEDYYYKADYWPSGVGAPFTIWLMPTTIPINASRIFLQVVESHIDKLQNMTLQDLALEGYPPTEEGWQQFKVTWNSIRGIKSQLHWRFNPDVEVIKFNILKMNDVRKMGYDVSKSYASSHDFYMKNSIILVKEIN